MKNSDKNEKSRTEDLNQKLEAIIEHSRAENEALKKILYGLEKNKKSIDHKKDSIKTKKKK